MKSMKLELVKTNNDLENDWSRARKKRSLRDHRRVQSMMENEEISQSIREAWEAFGSKTKKLLAAFALGSGILLSLAQSPHAHAQNSCTGRGCGGGSLQGGIMLDSYLRQNSIRRTDSVYRECVNPAIAQIRERLPMLGEKLARLRDTRTIALLSADEISRFVGNNPLVGYQHRNANSLLAIHMSGMPFVLADRAIYESSQLPRNLEYRCDFIFHELVVGLMLEDGRDLSKPEEQDRVIAINNALADFRDSEGAINDTQLFRMLDQSPNLVGFPRSNLNRLNAAFAREIQLYQDTCRSGQRYVAAHGRGDDYFSQMAHRNLSVIEGRSIIPFEDYDTQQAYARAGSYSPAQRLMQDIGGIAYMMRLSHVGVETHATPVEGRNWSFAIDCPKVQATVSAGGFVLSPHFELKLGGINGSVPELEVQGAAIGR